MRIDSFWKLFPGEGMGKTSMRRYKKMKAQLDFLSEVSRKQYEELSTMLEESERVNAEFYKTSNDAIFAMEIHRAKERALTDSCYEILNEIL
jgi:hypothetical protein